MSLYTSTYSLFGVKNQTSKTPVDAYIDFITDSLDWQDSFNIAPFPHRRGAQLEHIKFQPAGRVYEQAERA